MGSKLKISPSLFNHHYGFQRPYSQSVQPYSQDCRPSEVFPNIPDRAELQKRDNADTKILKWLEQQLGLKQIINDITRFSNTNSCIDLILTNSLLVFDRGTLDVNISDHEMIYVTRKHTKKTKNASFFEGRSYKHYDEIVLLRQLDELDWTNLFHCTNPEIAWSIMENNILKVIDDMCPIQTFYVKNLRDPWISQEILEAIKDKDRLLSKAKRSDNQQDWVIARQRRNEVKKLVKDAKSEFIKENLTQYENNSKKFWHSLKDVLPSQNSNNKISLKNKNGNLIQNLKELANEMNSFFTSIGPNLAKDMRDPWIYSGAEVVNNIPDITSNNEEILKLLKGN